MTLMIMSKMEFQLEDCNSNKLIHEMTEKLKHRSDSKMCLVPSNQNEHSDILETQDSEANFDKSKQCNNSLTPTNKSRLKPNFKNLFKRETKQSVKLHKTNQCDAVPRPKEHPSEPCNLYNVPVGDNYGNPPSGTSRCVDNESDIYEEVSEPQIPFGRSLDETSSMEKKETHQAGSVYQNMTVRPLSSGLQNRKPPYVKVLLDDDIETDCDASWDHIYDSVSHDDEQTGTNCNLNPIASLMCDEAEPVPVHPNALEIKKPLHADSSVSKKPPPVLPKAAYIKRGSSKSIHQEWCKLNDSISQPGSCILHKPVPPVKDSTSQPDRRILHKPVPPVKDSASQPDRRILHKPVPPVKDSTSQPDRRILHKPVPPVKDSTSQPDRRILHKPVTPVKDSTSQPDSCILHKPVTPVKDSTSQPDRRILHKPVPPVKDSTSQPDRRILHKPVTPVKDSTSEPDRRILHKPVPPVPVPRRPSSLPPNNELPEIEEELQVFRALLKQPKDVDINKIVIGNVNFTGRMLDSRGGRLQLTSHGVSLYIPPGALGDEPQEIFIYVQQNLKSSHHGFVSPIVHCGTSGLKFNIPVILTFPLHVKDTSRWELTGVRQDSSTKPWEDISDCSSDTMLLKDNLCTVVVDHFTGFGAVGRPNEPQASSVLPLRVKVYSSQNNAIDPVHGSVELRVYICDDSQETYELIMDKEKDSKLLLDKSRGFFLHISERGTHNADLDVTFELECLNRLWKTSFKKQIISLERCEVNHQVKEFCTLTLKIRPEDAAMGSKPRPLECEISICQSSYEDFGVTVRAVDQIGIRGRKRTGHCGMSIDIRLDDFDPMSLGRYRKLSDHLDSERRWKLLVKPCFIGKEAEQDFDKRVHPSAVVLGIIFMQGSIRESSMTTLVRLRSMLNECKLVRAAQIVHDDIYELKERHSGKDNGGIFAHPVQCSDDLQSHSDEAKLHRPTRTSVRNDEDHYEAISSDARYFLQDGHNDERPINHLQQKIPEENDEHPDRIHTLQSNQFIPTNDSVFDRSFPLQRPKLEPTQNNWPSENSQENQELEPSYAYCPQYDEMYRSVPQLNNNYQNLPKSNANLDTASYVSLEKNPK